MGVYTIFQQSGGGPLAAGDNGLYTMAMQFSLSRNMHLTGIWFNSQPGAASLPTKIGIFTVAGQALVAGSVNSSPSWSGAAASGWVKCTYPGTLTLTSGTNYKVAVYGGAGGTPWYGGATNYWSSGAGGSGITNGPLTAPNTAGADVGQDAFILNPGDLVYPTTTSNAGNYWVDVEVTDIPSASIASHFFPFNANRLTGFFKFR